MVTRPGVNRNSIGYWATPMMYGMPGGVQLSPLRLPAPWFASESFFHSWYSARYLPLSVGASRLAPGAPKVIVQMPPQSGSFSSAAYLPFGYEAPFSSPAE